jgi:hypothetical protein
LIQLRIEEHANWGKVRERVVNGVSAAFGDDTGGLRFAPRVYLFAPGEDGDHDMRSRVARFGLVFTVSGKPGGLHGVALVLPGHDVVGHRSSRRVAAKGAAADPSAAGCRVLLMLKTHE